MNNGAASKAVEEFTGHDEVMERNMIIRDKIREVKVEVSGIKGRDAQRF
jgi:hypothetical protein